LLPPENPSLDDGTEILRAAEELKHVLARAHRQAELFEVVIGQLSYVVESDVLSLEFRVPSAQAVLVEDRPQANMLAEITATSDSKIVQS
jgi:hypothetical protein